MEYRDNKGRILQDTQNLYLAADLSKARWELTKLQSELDIIINTVVVRLMESRGLNNGIITELLVKSTRHELQLAAIGAKLIEANLCIDQQLDYIVILLKNWELFDRFKQGVKKSIN